MLHFATVLGPKWTIVLFTIEEHWVVPSSPAFHRALDERRINVRFLPPNTALSDSQSVSRFLTKPWIWEQVQIARRILLFQTDSIVCSKAEAAIDDFLQYDFIGAPISPEFGVGYNGGLSIRNPKLFLNITRDASFDTSGIGFEDQWFYTESKAREANGVNLPDEAVAKTFAVETIYYETPLGYHQPTRWQPDHIEAIEQYCPEVKMLTGRRAI
ncbi:putative formate dehydrogenase protein [Hirsutella rhossiliensis]|uniref:Formate dehydrogenase protein n=1 Tax=Hirsutella rhossiliensis TaxID=111463 RepID=A0A9P8MU30_9HYPO|nr:putative formate dehydrogenase protein [Hirsutella rhossiliensis]KAH0959217.1 putative formate dehydrogenase protein [Hirsutella rhossiliensis]